jgi:hypothetical protein
MVVPTAATPKATKAAEAVAEVAGVEAVVAVAALFVTQARYRREGRGGGGLSGRQSETNVNLLSQAHLVSLEPLNSALIRQSFDSPANHPTNHPTTTLLTGEVGPKCEAPTIPDLNNGHPFSGIAINGGTQRLWNERTPAHNALGTVGYLPPGKFLEEVPRRYYLMVTPHTTGDGGGAAESNGYYAIGYGRIELKKEYYQTVPPSSQLRLYLHGTAAAALAAVNPKPPAYAIVGFDAWGGYSIQSNGTYLFSDFVPVYVHKSVSSKHAAHETKRHHKQAMEAWGAAAGIAKRETHHQRHAEASQTMQRLSNQIEKRQAAAVAKDEDGHAGRAMKAWARFHREDACPVYATPADLAAPAPAPSVWYDQRQPGEGNPFR